MADVDCKALVEKVWEDYRPGEEPPKVIFSSRKYGNATGGRFEITLPKWARFPIIVLHEIGHSLQSPHEAWHGPEFASLVLVLWEHYAKIPADEAKSMGTRQKPRRVRFAMAAGRHQQPTEEWKRWNRLKVELRMMLRECCENEPEKYEGDSK
jgi:hypothetical protein